MNASAAASKPFSFSVGPRGREFTIHSDIVAELSEALFKLVKGPFKEGAAGKVNWQHVDEGTFIYFWQYAYTGDYQFKAEQVSPKKNGYKKRTNVFTFGAPTATLASDAPAIGGGAKHDASSDSESSTESETDSFWQSHPYYKKRAKKTKKKKGKNAPPTKQELLWCKFIKLGRIAAPPDPFAIEPNAQATKDGCLLGHAQVYTLADCYGITKLRDLSYRKLHGCLMHMYVNDSPLAQFIVLARFCYESLVPDNLKQLIVHFATCEVERLWEDKQFQDLLLVYGEFSKDLIGSLRSRIE